MKFKLPKMGKAPVKLPHFPTKECAFVFRALEFFSYEKIAEILDTEPENIRSLGEAMGIYQDQKSDVWLKKGYITVIRSMWHLLPYEQLLKLLETDAETFAVLLREEDFLDIKLSDKPVCDKLSWKPFSEADNLALKRIKTSMDSLPLDGKEPFEFEYIMPDVEFSGKENFGARIIYLFSGLYQKCLDVDSEEYCPDSLLESYKRVGVNGIYIQGVLYLLTEFPFDKKLSAGYEKRLANLKRFTERCGKYGIKLYLYINEPRAMNRAFFEKYPHLEGHSRSDERICMCTSTKEVRDYITDAIETICKNAPLLGGFICMAKSENLTNCYSQVHKSGSCSCPKCKNRSVGEVIGELFAAIREGVDRVDPNMKVFDYSWDGDGIEERFDVIDHLPERVIVESICESGITFEIGGARQKLSDYSLNIIGPGERSLQMWERAKARGLETAAKVQINTTWECSTVPALPVLDKVDQLMTRLREAGVDHIQLSWTLGGYPSMNLLYACKYFFENAYIPQISEKMRKAAKLFSDAFSQFPSNANVAYFGPQNAGPSTLFYEEPTGYASTMTCYAFDDLAGWRGDRPGYKNKYPEDVFINQLEKLCAKWKEGLQLIQENPNTEIRLMAEAGYCLFRASLNLSKFVRLRDNNGTNKALYDIVLDERENAVTMLKLMNQNPAIGFEAANHYYFSRFSLCEKIVNCDYLLEKYTKVTGGNL